MEAGSDLQQYTQVTWKLQHGVNNNNNNINNNANIIGNSNNQNISAGDSNPQIPTMATIIVGMVLASIIVFTVLGNCLVVVAVASFRRLRSVTNYFVVSLAVADITVALLVMPYSLLFELYGEWTFGWVFCYFWISCDVTCCTASILHLCVISLDRYLAITEPLTYKTKMSKRRAILIICCVWLCSSAISFVPIYLGWFADPSTSVTLYQDSPQCGLFVNKTYAVISASLSFYVPLVVMVFVYLKIFRIAHRQAMEIQRLEQSVQASSHQQHIGARLRKRSRNLTKDTKAIKTLGTLMGLFCFSWLPFFLMYIIMPFCERCHLPAAAASVITWLGYANSCINPCVYAFLNRDFRIAFRKILSCNRLTRWFWKRRRRRSGQGLISKREYPTAGRRDTEATTTVLPNGEHISLKASGQRCVVQFSEPISSSSGSSSRKSIHVL